MASFEQPAGIEREWLALAALVLTSASLGCNIAGIGGGARAVLAVTFFLTIPGLPFGLRFVADRALTVVIVVGASSAITVLISVVMVETGVWHPLLAQAIIAAATAPTFLRAAVPHHARSDRGRQ